jgi:hypothetical protein
MAKDVAVQRMENRLARENSDDAIVPTSEDLVNFKVSDYFFPLEVGASCKGRYVGLGPDIEVTDQASGELVSKRSHRFEMLNGKGTFIIMEKAQLKQRLVPAMVGKTLIIHRQENLTKGAKQIGQYVFSEVMPRS